MTAEKAQALGIDAFCLKPFVLQDLGHTIRRVLRQRRDRGEGPKEVQGWFINNGSYRFLPLSYD